MTLYFYPKPVITCPPDLSVCIDEDPFLLSGASPEGGYYSGPGVLNNIFDPHFVCGYYRSYKLYAVSFVCMDYK
jgi:hypothetical protein